MRAVKDGARCMGGEFGGGAKQQAVREVDLVAVQGS